MADDGGGSSSVPKERRPRISLACTLCRHQKMRCTGGHPCERCRRGGHECIYESSGRPRSRKPPTGQSLGDELQAETSNNQAPSRALQKSALPGKQSDDENSSSNDGSTPSTVAPVRSGTTGSANQFFLNPAEESYSRLSPPRSTPSALPLGNLDVVTRNFITEEQGREYWDRFHDFCAYRVGWQDSKSSYSESRLLSPLHFCTVCSIGARSFGKDEDAVKLLNEARLMAQQKVFIADLTHTESDLYDLQGLLLLCIYWSMPHLIGQVVSIAYHLGLHTAFAKLTHPELRGSADEPSLIQRGRIWLLIYIYSNVFGLFYQQPLLIQPQPQLVTSQTSVLRSSRYSEPELDACFGCHAELMDILAKAKQSLSQGLTSTHNPGAYNEAPVFARQLSQWWEKWAQDEDSPFKKKSSNYFTTAYQLAEMYIFSFVFLPVLDGNDIASQPVKLEAATTASRCAQALLNHALDDTRGRPPFGLAVDFELVGMGFSVAVLLSVALSLPAYVDLLSIRTTMAKLFDSFYAEGTSPYAKSVMRLLSKLDTLAISYSSAVNQSNPPSPESSSTGTESEQKSRLDLLRQPQRLDNEARSLLEAIASDPSVLSFNLLVELERS